MKNTEIEIKLLFKNKAKIVSSLPKAKLIKTKTVHDVYYGLGHSDMSNSNQLVRVRNMDGIKTELTYKGKTQDINNVWKRKEINIDLPESKKIQEVLNLLGFNKISEYKSKKEYWQYGKQEISFAYFTLPAKLTFMEIEGPSRKGIEDTVKKIRSYVEEKSQEELFSVFDKARGVKK